MIAKAMGPQNTVGAIGIRPSTVEKAARLSGRMRELDAATTASQTFLPSARSVSICTTRMTAFLAIMPIRARMPRMATKPSGRFETSSARTTPMMLNGSTASTTNRLRNLPSWNISTVSINRIMIGTTANTEACDLALSSAMPPSSMR